MRLEYIRPFPLRMRPPIFRGGVAVAVRFQGVYFRFKTIQQKYSTWPHLPRFFFPNKDTVTTSSWPTEGDFGKTIWQYHCQWYWTDFWWQLRAFGPGTKDSVKNWNRIWLMHFWYTSCYTFSLYPCTIMSKYIKLGQTPPQKTKQSDNPINHKWSIRTKKSNCNLAIRKNFTGWCLLREPTRNDVNIFCDWDFLLISVFPSNSQVASSWDTEFMVCF